MVKNAIVSVGFLVGGFALSSWWSAREHRASPPEAAQAQEGPTAPAGAPPSAVDLVALRGLIREELQRAKSADGAGPARAAAAEGADDPSAPVRPRSRSGATPAQIAASAAATTLVDAGLAEGRWTEQDEAQWQELSAELAPDDAQAARGRLFEAVNEGRVVAEPRFGRRAGMPQPVAVRTP